MWLKCGYSIGGDKLTKCLILLGVGFLGFVEVVRLEIGGYGGICCNLDIRDTL